jgi:hypothetical protein
VVSWISVSISPGATALTRTPSPASSFASPIVIVSIAAFEAAYQTKSPGLPSVAAPEETLTIAPPAPPRRVEMPRIRLARDQQRAGDVEVDHRADARRARRRRAGWRGRRCRRC